MEDIVLGYDSVNDYMVSEITLLLDYINFGIQTLQKISKDIQNNNINL